MPLPELDRRKKMLPGRNNVRETALRIIQSVHRDACGDTPLPVMLAAAGYEGHEKSFLDDAVYGVLRLRSPLDGVLRRFLSRPSALSALLRHLLRMGAHELLFMDYVPAHATVDELVSLARSRAGGRSAGLVNAVLRRIAESAESLRKEIGESLKNISSTADIAEAASIPEWLARDWARQYGIAAAADLARSLVASPQPCWRVNMLRPGAEELLELWQGRGKPCGGHGFYYPGEAHDVSWWGILEDMERKGKVSRQGAASQMVAERTVRNLRSAGMADAGLWDCCCGRGGKTAALLEQGVRVAFASDPSEFRLREFRINMERLGISCPPCQCMKAQDAAQRFPVIFLDAPCSGTGTLARNPELRLRISAQRMDAAENLQKELLRSVWRNLLPGGMLFYATCALNRRENEDQIGQFLKEYPQAKLQGMETLLPPSPGQDALFMAVLRRSGE